MEKTGKLKNLIKDFPSLNERFFSLNERGIKRHLMLLGRGILTENERKKRYRKLKTMKIISIKPHSNSQNILTLQH